MNKAIERLRAMAEKHRQWEEFSEATFLDGVADVVEAAMAIRPCMFGVIGLGRFWKAIDKLEKLTHE